MKYARWKTVSTLWPSVGALWNRQEKSPNLIWPKSKYRALWIPRCAYSAKGLFVITASTLQIISRICLRPSKCRNLTLRSTTTWSLGRERSKIWVRKSIPPRAKGQKRVSTRCKVSPPNKKTQWKRTSTPPTTFCVDPTISMTPAPLIKPYRRLIRDTTPPFWRTKKREEKLKPKKKGLILTPWKRPSIPPLSIRSSCGRKARKKSINSGKIRITSLRPRQGKP